MTRDIFNKLIDELDASSKNVLKNKNALYGKKDDPLHNFKEGASIANCTPAQLGNKTQWNAIRKIQRNTVGDTVNGAYTPTIDLCPECMNEFEKFMSVKFQENKNDEN